MSNNNLFVVGTGIRSVGQVTIEARNLIIGSEMLLYLVADPITEAWIKSLNPKAESMADCYIEGRQRNETYREIVQRILERLRQGHDVCAVFYGHPGVFVNPSHEAIRQARREGFTASMLPGISAEDCLFADLGIDPGDHGCQSFEATDFLLQQRRFDPTSHLILWQVGVVGEIVFRHKTPYRREGLKVLSRELLRTYPAEQPVVLYEASVYAVCDPVMQRIALQELETTEVSTISTLYVTPLPQRPRPKDILQRLGLRPE